MKLKLYLPRPAWPKVVINTGVIPPAVFILGLVAFSWGLWLAWAPLGPIGAGLVLMAIAVFGEPHA